MNFGEKLQMLRKEQNLSQEALAEKLEVSRQAVSKWENCESYPETDKLILISNLFQVSLDYLMKEDEALTVDGNKEREKKIFLNREKINEYIGFKNSFGRRIAFGVFLIIASLNLPIGFAETKYETLATAGFLILVGLSVALFILTGLSGEKFFKLQREKINLSYGDLQEISDRQLKFKSGFGVAIAMGVFLIILSVGVCVVLTEYLQMDKIGGMLLITGCATAVYIFVSQCIKNGTYKFLVQNEEYINENVNAVKDAQNKAKEDRLFGITMPLAAMVYLVMGFAANLWHPGWLVFPITVFITMGIIEFTKKD